MKKWLIAALAIVAALSQLDVLPPVLADIVEVIYGELDVE